MLEFKEIHRLLEINSKYRKNVLDLVVEKKSYAFITWNEALCSYVLQDASHMRNPEQLTARLLFINFLKKYSTHDK